MGSFLIKSATIIIVFLFFLLSKGDCLSIPPGWLCYLAPELLLRLTPTQQLESDLPFSKGSDIYAFGTVWYELLCGEWPYKELPPEAIIWQVGSGIRQPLPTLFSRDAKVARF